LNIDPVDHPKLYTHLNPCPYGSVCALKLDEQHCEKYSHSSDPVVTKPAEKEKPEIVKKPCPMNPPCKLTSDPKHMEQYTHDKPEPVKQEGHKLPCSEGNKCLLLLQGDKSHIQRYTHTGPPSQTAAAPTPVQTAPKAKCPFGSTCEVAKTSPDHMKNFDHSGPPQQTNSGSSQVPSGGSHQPVPSGGSQKPMCSNPYTCSMTGDFAHKQQYRHFCRNGTNCRNQNDPVHMDRFVHKS